MSKIRKNGDLRGTASVCLIGASGEMLSEVALAEALRAGLDLVEVNPRVHPPVCKLMDFAKYQRESRGR